MMSNVDPPEDPPPARRPLPSDLPLLYVLLAIHVAVLLCLPVAAWFAIRLVRALPNPPGLLVPALLVAVLLVEAGLLWRTLRVWRRVRGGR